jgi:DNA polymerase elongation subunit (family B)
LHEDVLALDYDSEYANLIVNHNLSYETVGGGEARKGLLPTVVGRFLKRRQHFKKKLLKEIPKDSEEYVCCEQRVNSLKYTCLPLWFNRFSLEQVWKCACF